MCILRSSFKRKPATRVLPAAVGSTVLPKPLGIEPGLSWQMQNLFGALIYLARRLSQLHCHPRHFQHHCISPPLSFHRNQTSTVVWKLSLSAWSLSLHRFYLHRYSLFNTFTFSIILESAPQKTQTYMIIRCFVLEP